jgi:hypothetical protein
MYKTASDIANDVLVKCGFSVGAAVGGAAGALTDPKQRAQMAGAAKKYVKNIPAVRMGQAAGKAVKNYAGGVADKAMRMGPTK